MVNCTAGGGGRYCFFNADVSKQNVDTARGRWCCYVHAVALIGVFFGCRGGSFRVYVTPVGGG